MDAATGDEVGREPMRAAWAGARGRFAGSAGSATGDEDVVFDAHQTAA